MDDAGTNHTTPGQFITALLEKHGWTKRTLAAVLDMDEPKVNRITSNRQPITAEVAILLEEVFGVKAESFLDQQKLYDLALARLSARPNHHRATRAALYSSLPISEMIRRGWLTVHDIRDQALEHELARFFGANRAEDIEILSHAAKKTKVSADIKCRATCVAISSQTNCYGNAPGCSVQRGKA